MKLLETNKAEFFLFRINSEICFTIASQNVNIENKDQNRERGCLGIFTAMIIKYHENCIQNLLPVFLNSRIKILKFVAVNVKVL